MIFFKQCGFNINAIFFQCALAIVFLLQDCHTVRKVLPTSPPVVISYTFNQPNKEFELDARLTEISGLSLCQNPNQLCAVQDEEGILFYLNKANGKIEQEVPFYPKGGDFEGIEWVNEAVYAVKSNGDIYEILNPGTEAQKINIFETSLDKTADVEGLAYDSIGKHLLLICKNIVDNLKSERHIYTFDLHTKKLSEKPTFIISKKMFQDYLKTHNNIENYDKLAEKYLDSATDDWEFAPSGIAIQPQTKEMYILSSVGKLLIVLSSKGEIVHINKLDKEIHRQPEGIVFDADGTLYISNEGKKGYPPMLYRYFSDAQKKI